MREPSRSLQPAPDLSLDAELGAHGPWLKRAARRLGFAGADAEDLAQVVLSTFLEVRPRFAGRSSLRTFLFGILRRKAAEMRRRARGSESARTWEGMRADVMDGEAQLSSAQLGRAIDECIDELSAKQRRALQLRLQERPTEDATGELGVTANYLGVLLNRARAHLRECIHAHGF